MWPNANPYEPPRSVPSVRVLWDRSVVIQLGMVFHLLVCLLYCLAVIDDDRPASEIIQMIGPRVHAVAAACTAVGFCLVCSVTISKRDWPLHLRGALIGIDAGMVGLLIHVSHGFGTR